MAETMVLNLLISKAMMPSEGKVATGGWTGDSKEDLPPQGWMKILSNAMQQGTMAAAGDPENQVALNSCQTKDGVAAGQGNSRGLFLNLPVVHSNEASRARPASLSADGTATNDLSHPVQGSAGSVTIDVSHALSDPASLENKEYRVQREDETKAKTIWANALIGALPDAVIEKISSKPPLQARGAGQESISQSLSESLGKGSDGGETALFSNLENEGAAPEKGILNQAGDMAARMPDQDSSSSKLSGEFWKIVEGTLQKRQKQENPGLNPSPGGIQGVLSASTDAAAIGGAETNSPVPGLNLQNTTHIPQGGLSGPYGQNESPGNPGGMVAAAGMMGLLGKYSQKSPSATEMGGREGIPVLRDAENPTEYPLSIRMKGGVEANLLSVKENEAGGTFVGRNGYGEVNSNGQQASGRREPHGIQMQVMPQNAVPAAEIEKGSAVPAQGAEKSQGNAWTSGLTGGVQPPGDLVSILMQQSGSSERQTADSDAKIAFIAGMKELVKPDIPQHILPWAYPGSIQNEKHLAPNPSNDPRLAAFRTPLTNGQSAAEVDGVEEEPVATDIIQNSEDPEYRYTSGASGDAVRQSTDSVMSDWMIPVMKNVRGRPGPSQQNAETAHPVDVQGSGQGSADEVGKIIVQAGNADLSQQEKGENGNSGIGGNVPKEPFPKNTGVLLTDLKGKGGQLAGISQKETSGVQVRGAIHGTVVQQDGIPANPAGHAEPYFKEGAEQGSSENSDSLFADAFQVSAGKDVAQENGEKKAIYSKDDVRMAGGLSDRNVQISATPERQAHTITIDTIGDVVQKTIASAKGATSEIRVALQPENLGFLNMRIGVERGQIQVHITTDNTTTRDILNHQIHLLRSDLENKGLVIERIHVEVSDGHPDANAWGGGEQPSHHQQQHESDGTLFADQISGQSDPASESQRVVMGTQSPADRRLSMFV